ncbi:MAG TPA: response regulator [Terriglobales bacterium]|nr:response regulator [Terriglobales bacterium]
MRILFVDDEPNIRASLPAILRLHGFQVTSAGTVGEALQAIASEKFDVLISDLNIGSPGDGFTVVSAMRRTQPNCVTLILTGYPAFETALQAIRSQVDDYLIKPAGAEKLVKAIEARLNHRAPHRPIVPKRVSAILLENAQALVDTIVDRELRILHLPRVHLSEEECRQNALSFVEALALQLENGRTELLPDLVELSAAHGQARFRQGYSAPLLVEEHRLFCNAVLECVQNNLLAVDVSSLVPDLKHLSDILASMLREAVASFTLVSDAA